MTDLQWIAAARVCGTCKTGYNGDLSQHFHKSTRDGYQTVCKTCKSNHGKKLYQQQKANMRLPESFETLVNSGKLQPQQGTINQLEQKFGVSLGPIHGRSISAEGNISGTAAVNPLATKYSDTPATKGELDKLREMVFAILEVVGDEKVNDILQRKALRHLFRTYTVSASDIIFASPMEAVALGKIVKRQNLTADDEDVLIAQGWLNRDLG